MSKALKEAAEQAIEDRKWVRDALSKTGANGIQEGDRIVNTQTHQRGVAGEFFQDGDVEVHYDNGIYAISKWRYLMLETEYDRRN